MGLFVNHKQNPLICVPITGRTVEEIEDQLQQVITVHPEVIEWRADFFTLLADTDAVLDVLERIERETDIPLLFTIRSEREGGEPISLAEEGKVALLEAVCKQGKVTAVDYEVENEVAFVEAVSEAAKEAEVDLVLSYHHFSETPSTDQLIELGERMESYGASVAKLAVMPQAKEDVDRLLMVTRTLDRKLQIPVITMSMGELGVISRIIGWAFGSVLTFAVGVESSAPGQVPIKKLRSAIDSMQSITDGVD